MNYHHSHTHVRHSGSYVHGRAVRVDYRTMQSPSLLSVLFGFGTKRPQRSVRGSARHSVGSLVTFALVASFGLLMVGCGPTKQNELTEEYKFTAEDAENFQKIITDANDQETGDETPYIEGIDNSLPVAETALDPETMRLYQAIRTSGTSVEQDYYKVISDIANVREAPSTQSPIVATLNRGDSLQLQNFYNAEWAYVTLQDGSKGYVTQQFIGNVTGDDRLAQKKEEFQGQYFVDFPFLNVRAEPSTSSAKLGELPGQAILTPITIDSDWARITYEDLDGYVSSQYLSAFLPNFIVRQENFTLPILIYDVASENMIDALLRHIDALQNAGANMITMSDYRDFLIEQEERDVRVPLNSVIIGIVGLNRENFAQTRDALIASRAVVTFFVETQDLNTENGLSTVEIQALATLGNDIQSATHSSEDLRSLTNAQVELEISQSRSLLEEITSNPVFALVYPNGGINERVEQMVINKGYLFGVGISPGRTFTRSDFLTLPSYRIAASMSQEEIVSTVLGQ